MEKMRLTYVDHLRLISIFAVVVLHTAAIHWSEVPVLSQSWRAVNFYDSICRFCVPVLIMISGLLFLNPTQKITYSKLFGRSVPRLMVAYFAGTACYQFLFPSPNTDFFHQQYHFWFLPLLAALYLLTPILRKLTMRGAFFSQLIWMLCFCFVLAFPAYREIPELKKAASFLASLHLPELIGYCGYFVLGYSLSQQSFSPNTRVCIYITGLLGTTLTVFLTHLASEYQALASTVFYSNFSPNVMAASVAVFVLVKNKSVSKTGSKLLVSGADCCFGIYFIHDLILHLFHSAGLFSFIPLPLSIPLESASIFLICYLIVFFFKKLARLFHLF